LLLRDLLASLRVQEIQYAEIFVAIGQMHRADIDPAKVLPELSRIARESHDGGGPRIGFIADATRQWGVAACDRVLDTALQLQEFDIVGFGVGGDERALRARELKAVYRRAAAAELGLSCHAGEGSSADAVREVVEELGVRRVGHGIAAAADSRLMRELAEEDVLLEICPTSNRLTGAWREGDHPMLRLHAAGVPLCLGSDDPAFFGCTLESECALVREWGLGDQDMDAFRQNAWRHTFSQS
jgi:adenosine deaminase